MKIEESNGHQCNRLCCIVPKLLCCNALAEIRIKFSVSLAYTGQSNLSKADIDRMQTKSC